MRQRDEIYRAKCLAILLRGRSTRRVLCAPSANLDWCRSVSESCQFDRPKRARG
jgi:hypothetical protein